MCDCVKVLMSVMHACKTYLQRESSQGRNGYESSHEECNHVVDGRQSHTGTGATQTVSRPLLKNENKHPEMRGGEERRRGEGEEERSCKGTLKGMLLPASVKE